jgi:hypothetical protein
MGLDLHGSRLLVCSWGEQKNRAGKGNGRSVSGSGQRGSRFGRRVGHSGGGRNTVDWSRGRGDGL